MDAQMRSFHKRMHDINRKHAKLARGYVTSVNHDGLIIARPRRQARWFPWRGLLFALIAVMSIKALMFSQMGAQPFEERVARLNAGSTAEQVAAFVLKADPATVYLGNLILKAGL